MLSAWLPWIAAPALVLVLAVLLRFAGEEPDNAITQEQPGDDGDQDPVPDLGGLPLAA